MYPVREAALVGGEAVNYQLDALGAVKYLEIKPTESADDSRKYVAVGLLEQIAVGRRGAVAAVAIRPRHRYALRRQRQKESDIRDVRSSLRSSARTASRSLKGGKIRSALRLTEQLFVINKRYYGSTVASYTFTGRGWGHGVGMCQYGAFGLAKMGVKYDEIIKALLHRASS